MISFLLWPVNQNKSLCECEYVCVCVWKSFSVREKPFCGKQDSQQNKTKNVKKNLYYNKESAHKKKQKVKGKS